MPLRQTGALESLVSDVSGRLDRVLLEQLFGRYRLLEHLDAIKRYLLLGQGDFVQALMDLVGPQLDRRASEISEYGMGIALDAAIRASVAQYDSPDLLGCLRIRLDQHTATETGARIYILWTDSQGQKLGRAWVYQYTQVVG